MISEIIEKWIKGILIDGITGNLSGLFDNVKPKTDTTGHDDLDEYDFGEDEDADEEPTEIEENST